VRGLRSAAHLDSSDSGTSAAGPLAAGGGGSTCGFGDPYHPQLLTLVATAGCVLGKQVGALPPLVGGSLQQLLGALPLPSCQLSVLSGADVVPCTSMRGC
jgi:hypothetical protein